MTSSSDSEAEAAESSAIMAEMNPEGNGAYGSMEKIDKIRFFRKKIRKIDNKTEKINKLSSFFL